jgi:hypothetical protein
MSAWRAQQLQLQDFAAAQSSDETSSTTTLLVAIHGSTEASIADCFAKMSSHPSLADMFAAHLSLHAQKTQATRIAATLRELVATQESDFYYVLPEPLTPFSLQAIISYATRWVTPKSTRVYFGALAVEQPTFSTTKDWRNFAQQTTGEGVVYDATRLPFVALDTGLGMSAKFAVTLALALTDSLLVLAEKEDLAWRALVPRALPLADDSTARWVLPHNAPCFIRTPLNTWSRSVLFASDNTWENATTPQCQPPDSASDARHMRMENETAEQPPPLPDNRLTYSTVMNDALPGDIPGMSDALPLHPLVPLRVSEVCAIALHMHVYEKNAPQLFTSLSSMLRAASAQSFLAKLPRDAIAEKVLFSFNIKRSKEERKIMGWHNKRKLSGGREAIAMTMSLCSRESQELANPPLWTRQAAPRVAATRRRVSVDDETSNETSDKTNDVLSKLVAEDATTTTCTDRLRLDGGVGDPSVMYAVAIVMNRQAASLAELQFDIHDGWLASYIASPLPSVGVVVAYGSGHDASVVTKTPLSPAAKAAGIKWASCNMCGDDYGSGLCCKGALFCPPPLSSLLPSLLLE